MLINFFYITASAADTNSVAGGAVCYTWKLNSPNQRVAVRQVAYTSGSVKVAHQDGEIKERG
jgi:hypothetical protein